mgnify:CR=1 FL=1
MFYWTILEAVEDALEFTEKVVKKTGKAIATSLIVTSTFVVDTVTLPILLPFAIRDQIDYVQGPIEIPPPTPLLYKNTRDALYS